MYIICDIDGTIANIDHRVDKYLSNRQSSDIAWSAFFKECDKDKPIPNTVKLLNKLTKTTPVIFITGRSEIVRGQTAEWLLKHINIRELMLYMRPELDRRPDSVIKKEIIDNLNITPEDVLTIFEDRKSVVDMWRSQGFHVCQVNDGNF